MRNEDQAWLGYHTIYADVYDESNCASLLHSARMQASYHLIEYWYPFFQPTSITQTVE